MENILQQHWMTGQSLRCTQNVSKYRYFPQNHSVTLSGRVCVCLCLRLFVCVCVRIFSMPSSVCGLVQSTSVFLFCYYTTSAVELKETRWTKTKSNPMKTLKKKIRWWGLWSQLLVYRFLNITRDLILKKVVFEKLYQSTSNFFLSIYCLVLRQTVHWVL